MLPAIDVVLWAIGTMVATAVGAVGYLVYDSCKAEKAMKADCSLLDKRAARVFTSLSQAKGAGLTADFALQAEKVAQDKHNSYPLSYSSESKCRAAHGNAYQHHFFMQMLNTGNNILVPVFYHSYRPHLVGFQVAGEAADRAEPVYATAVPDEYMRRDGQRVRAAYPAFV